ncbi:LysE family translocator [Pokkaliibacter sp. CJK22405]|uniref:LysE family translocator n=1 Tax=Pokkaliibacter sp. CJK22405 TaxID=3384615 RepID=UPI0039856761
MSTSLFSLTLGLQLLGPMVAFAFLMAGTPGPNNMMLTASGARFGWRRTLPHILGISVGSVVMIVLAGMGLAQLFIVFPACRWVMKAIGGAYLLWLAWKLWMAEPGKSALPFLDRPMRWHEAVLFQGVNPKAWMMATTLISLFALAPSQTLQVTLMGCIIFGLVALCTGSAWTWLGQSVKRWLNQPGRERGFNRLLSLLLVGCVIWFMA